jgi:ABC-type dipeptide/oligopeptide/nickel transport system permease subunit
MTPLRILGIVILVAGVVFLILGIDRTDTLGEELHEEITGEYSDETMWYIGGGIAGIVVGIALLIFGGRRKKVMT